MEENIIDNIVPDDIYVYMINLPDGVKEAVVPCFLGYTVYINQRLSYEARKKAFAHALLHIRNRDFEKSNVQEVESEAHSSKENVSGFSFRYV